MKLLIIDLLVCWMVVGLVAGKGRERKQQNLVFFVKIRRKPTD